MATLDPTEPDRPDHQDLRQFVKISIDIVMNSKIAAAMEEDPLAGWAAVCAIVHCFQSRTDGHFPIKQVAALARLSEAGVKAMIEEDLWHVTGHDCERCPQPRRGHAYSHDYLRHQRSAEKLREISRKRSGYGSKGAEGRWGTAEERAKRKAERAAAKARTAAPKQPAKEEPPREDVDKVCNYLADWISRNHPKGTRPPINKTWREAARKLIDLDGRSVEEIGEMIRWTQLHDFQHQVILSMAKLREKWDELEIKRKAEGDRRLRAGNAARRGPAREAGQVNYDGQNNDFYDQFGADRPAPEPLPFDQEHQHAA